jgi:hypothetical protein
MPVLNLHAVIATFMNDLASARCLPRCSIPEIAYVDHPATAAPLMRIHRSEIFNADNEAL